MAGRESAQKKRERERAQRERERERESTERERERGVCVVVEVVASAPARLDKPHRCAATWQVKLMAHLLTRISEL